MDNTYIVIIELLAVMVVIIVVAWVIVRDKKAELSDLREVNDSLLRQVDEMQKLVGEHSEGNEAVAEGIEDLSKQVHLEVASMLNGVGDGWSDMEQLAQQQQNQLKGIEGLVSTGEEIDVAELQKQIKELNKSLMTAEKKANRQAKELNKAKDAAKELKEKVKDLSRRVLEMSSLAVKEQRLQRDKERLKERLAKLKEKYDNEKVIARNLRQELKTSFRADEVKGLRDELSSAEQELERSLAEKKFIETHFVSLDEVAQEKEKVQEQLDRAKREIETLERSIIEMDEAEKSLKGQAPS